MENQTSKSSPPNQFLAVCWEKQSKKTTTEACLSYYILRYMNKCVHFAAKLKKRCSYTLRFEVLFNKTSIRISYFFNAKKKLANRNTHRWQKSTYAKSIRRLWLMNKKKVRNPFPPSILIGHGNKTKKIITEETVFYSNVHTTLQTMHSAISPIQSEGVYILMQYAWPHFTYTHIMINAILRTTQYEIPVRDLPITSLIIINELVYYRKQERDKLLQINANDFSL